MVGYTRWPRQSICWGGGRASLRRAESLYRCDERLFVECLDALCCGNVGAHETFAAFCADGRAVAAALGSETAARLLVTAAPIRAAFAGADFSMAATKAPLDVAFGYLGAVEGYVTARMEHLSGLEPGSHGGLLALLTSEDADAVLSCEEALVYAAETKALQAAVLASPELAMAVSGFPASVSALGRSEAFLRAVATAGAPMQHKVLTITQSSKQVLSNAQRVVVAGITGPEPYGVGVVGASGSLESKTEVVLATNDLFRASPIPTMLLPMAPLYRYGNSNVSVGARNAVGSYQVTFHYMELPEEG